MRTVSNMRKSNPDFLTEINEATDSLMKEFIAWNDIQEELKEGGYTHNHYCDEEMTHKRHIFGAIAERFVLEDIDYKKWEWFETPWVGTDGNTGEEAYVVDFIMTDSSEPEQGILGFYVTRNHRFWYALPLAELMEDGIVVYEVNSIHTALNISGERTVL